MPPAEKALALAPDNPDMLAQRAAVLTRLERPQEALADLNKAIELLPNTSYLHVARGYVYAELGQFHESIDDHSLAISLNKDAVLSYAGRAYSRAQLGEIDEAFEDVEYALKRDPNLVPAIHTYADLLFRRVRFQEALPQYTRGIELKPEDAYLWSGRGGVYSALDEVNKALSDYNKAIELAPNRPPLYSARGNLLARMGRLTEATADHNKAVKLSQNSPTTLVSRGQFFLDWTELYSLALEDFDKAVAMAPDMADAFLGRGEAYLALDKPRVAILDFNKAIELAPSIMFAYTARGEAYEAIGEPAKAEADYRYVLQITPTYSPALLGLGYLQLSRDEFAEARKNFDSALDHASDPEQVWAARKAVGRLLVRLNIKDYSEFPVDLVYDIHDDEELMKDNLRADDLLDLDLKELPEIPIDNKLAWRTGTQKVTVLQ